VSWGILGLLRSPFATQGRSHSGRANRKPVQYLWERPCVAKGAQSAPAF